MKKVILSIGAKLDTVLALDNGESVRDREIPLTLTLSPSGGEGMRASVLTSIGDCAAMAAKLRTVLRCALVLLLALLPVAVVAADTDDGAGNVEAKYTSAIEGRTVDILKVLGLSDTNKAARVHDIIIAQYRSLRSWHDENDAKLKAVKSDTNATAQIRASLKELHGNFLSALAQNLSPEQIEQVKDKMTYGKVQFTLAGYVSQYPGLSEENKAEILRLLKEAREEAMDGGSAAEKTAVFQRYKGKINNYLSKQGLRPGKKGGAA